MKKIISKINLTALYLMIAVNQAFAANPISGLVPCGNAGQPACGLCDLLQLGKNLITFFLELTIAFAGLFFAWGTFVIMTAGDSEERVKEGKKILTITVTGLLIAFSAWILIGTVIQFLTDSPSKLPWNQIQCNY